MTRKPPTLDPRVMELFDTLVAAVEPIGVPYAIGGALAMIPYGIRRNTMDVDAFFLESNRNAVMRALRKQKDIEISTINEPFHYVAYMDKHEDPEIRIDVLFPAGEPEISAIEYPNRVSLFGHDVNVFSVELLVISKFYSDRLKDEMDIAALYNTGAFEPITVRALIADSDPDGAQDFSKLIQKLSTPRVGRKRPPRKK